VSAPYKNAILFILNAVVDWLCLATDLIAQTALSSLPRVIYYLEQLFSKAQSIGYHLRALNSKQSTCSTAKNRDSGTI
ncbi:hypothetical protein, partial [Pseudoalteromonas sp. bablab_jr011]|uniref:hypothetical protein n=1 Tax=Pseudoalteromonas sp. bablab_jr011 TaxID=2755062 RepID=UPI001A7EE66A